MCEGGGIWYSCATENACKCLLAGHNVRYIHATIGNLFDVLQANKCDVASAANIASAQTRVGKSKRSEAHYFYKSVVQASNDIEMALRSKRVSKVPPSWGNSLTCQLWAIGLLKQMDHYPSCLLKNITEELYFTPLWTLSLSLRWKDDSMLKSVAGFPDKRNLLQLYSSEFWLCQLHMRSFSSLRKKRT